MQSSSKLTPCGAPIWMEMEMKSCWSDGENLQSRLADPELRFTILRTRTGPVEDLTVADLNQDGLLDIIAVGRATHNVKIYLNQGAGK
jgi:hypothetical protein